VRLLGIWLGLFWMVVVNFDTSAKPLRLPYPRALYHKVEFWKKIYTAYTTSQGILHDSDDLSIIYEEVQLPPSGDQSIVNERRSKIREALFDILRKRGQNLTSFDRKILSRFPKYASRSRLLEATENIRFQLGQSDRFRKGVIESGRYMKDIEKILQDDGAPDFLKYLPHVESSFQEHAMSKYGAAGLWQLMPRTGRQFLRVNYSVDERLDPWIATKAAAKYLLQNYRRLGEWPLAITAYNHGAGGVERAARSLGTTDIADIAFQYSTPQFGFASRNFYAQFLAAVQVAQDYQKYFGNLPIKKLYRFKVIKIKKPTFLKQIEHRYQFSMDQFKPLNLALRKPVYQNRRPIPKGTIIRLPRGSKKRIPVMIASLDKKIAAEAIEAVKEPAPDLHIGPPAPKKVIQKASPKQSKPSNEVAVPALDDNLNDAQYAVRDFANGKGWIKVGMDETISQIAEWLGVKVKDIRNWNGIEARGQVRLRQRLLLKFPSRDTSRFISARSDYHRQIREDFFSQYDVSSFLDYTVQVGENLWSICYQKFEIPPWLLEQFNPSVDLGELKAGTKLKIPVLQENLRRVSEDSPSKKTDNSN